MEIFALMMVIFLVCIFLGIPIAICIGISKEIRLCRKFERGPAGHLICRSNSPRRKVCFTDMDKTTETMRSC